MCTETKLWTTKLTQSENILTQLVDQKIAEAIIEVRKGNFCFAPPGYDGTYGELTIGETSNYHGIKLIEGKVRASKQHTLDKYT